MIEVFFILSFLLSGGYAWRHGFFTTWNALWQFPLAFLIFFLALVILFVLVLFLSTRFVNPHKELDRPSTYFRFMLNQFCRLILFLARVQVHTTGLEKVPRDRRFMLVSNHLFAYDPVIYYNAMPWADLAFLSKKENFSLVMVAEIMREVLCLPLDRENDREALKAILKAIQFLKEDKCSIGVFAEGGTSKTGELKPFRNGAFKIAQRAQVPVVVCAVANTRAILHNMFLRRTDVYLDVLGVIEPEQFAGCTTIQIGNMAHEMMEQGVEARKNAMAKAKESQKAKSEE